MDSIFDEEVDEVGGEIEAYCPSPRCKADTTHTIISMYEDEVRRVQCVVCGEVHAYRKPRGDGPDESGGPAEPGAPKRAQSTRATWKEAMSRASESDLANCRPYSIRDTYEVGDVVLHPKFDVGFVTELLPDNKVAMVFRDEPEPRVLVHNRGDLAPQMPGISEIPPPRDAKKKKRPKKKEDGGAPVNVRSEADVEGALEKARNAAAAKTEEGQRVVATRLTDQKKKAKGGKADAKAAAVPKADAKGAKVAAAAKGAKPTPPPKVEPAKATAKAPAKKAPPPAKAAPKKAAPPPKAAKKAPLPKKAAPKKKAAPVKKAAPKKAAAKKAAPKKKKK